MDAAGGVIQTVGLVGQDERVERGVRAADVSTVRGSAAAVLEAGPDVVLGVGESAMVSLARRQPDVPLLPIDAGPGLRSIHASAVADVLSRYQSETWKTATSPLLAVTIEDAQTATALFDATLVTDQPASISEYSIAADGERIQRVRADGVVTATPAGTAGYARAVGTPRISPAASVTAVAPIAPFTTDPETWVVADDVAVTVERDGTPVAVLADDRTVATVDVGTTVTVARDATVDIVVVPESRPSFVREDGRLEKH